MIFMFVDPKDLVHFTLMRPKTWTHWSRNALKVAAYNEILSTVVQNHLESPPVALSLQLRKISVTFYVE